MVVKKLLKSLLLGSVNAFILTIIPFLVTNPLIGDSLILYAIFNAIFILYFIILLILSLINIFKYYVKFFKSSSLPETIWYSIFYTGSWLLVINFISSFTNLESLWVLGLLILFFYILIFTIIFITSIIFIIKSYLKDKRILLFIIGIILYILIPFINFCSINGIFINLYTDNEVLKKFNEKYNIESSTIESVTFEQEENYYEEG